MSLLTLELSWMHHPTLSGQAASLQAIPVMCMTQDALHLCGHLQPRPHGPRFLLLFLGAGLTTDASCC